MSYLVDELRSIAKVVPNGGDVAEAANYIEYLERRVELMKEALALHRSMVLGGERPSETSEAAFIAVMAGMEMYGDAK